MNSKKYVLDIGSNYLRGGIIEISRKQIKLLKVIERPLELNEKLMPAITDLVARLPLGKNSLIININQNVYSRILSFPFDDYRKIESLIKYELGDMIPLDIEDVVVAHGDLHTSGSGNQTRIFTGGAEREYIENLIKTVEDAGGEVSYLIYSPCRLVIQVPKVDYPLVAVNFGDKFTELALIENGKLKTGRIIKTGLETIVEKLANEFNQSTTQMKNWFFNSAQLREPSGDEEEYQKIMRNQLLRQMENWRRFLLVSSDLADQKIEKIYLAGEGAALDGIIPFAEDVFSLPVEISKLPLPEQSLVNNSLIALGMTSDLSSSQFIDFRSGEFARNAGYSLVKDKIRTVLFSMTLFFVMLLISGFLTLDRLQREEEALLGVVGQMSREVLGKTIFDPYRINRRVKKRKSRSKQGSISETPVPEMSAFTILSKISANLPPRKKVKEEESSKESGEENKSEDAKTDNKNEKKEQAESKVSAKIDDENKESEKEKVFKPIALDITKIQIRTGKVKISGVVDSAEDVDEIIQGLERISCFEEIKTGKIKSIGEGENEKRQFSLDIKMNCL
ncbi:MAG: hypothetical protein PF689_09185 [Deltaproteobacteria bacterium]|jgi:Tfp pilus assembly PilM family ATPase|nr:hypothetical protein [Deltaproteobacteria bacterium]